MFRFWSFILSNALRSPRRTLLTVASIAISLCLLTVLAAMYRALFVVPETTPAEALRLVTHHRISITQPLPVSFLPRIRNIPGVRDSMIWQWFGGTYRDARDARNFFARFAVEPERFFAIKPEVQLPDQQRLAFQHTRSGCVVGSKLRDRFHWKIGDRIAIAGDIYPVTLELTLVGVYSAPQDDENLYFSYEYLRQLLLGEGQSSRADKVGVFLTLGERKEEIDAIAASIDKQFEDSPAPTKSESESAWQLSFVSFLGNLKLFLLSISGALVFTTLLVSGNTISMSIRERTREVGILKTLGFTQKMILGIFMGETLLIAMVGGVFGVLFGELLTIAVRLGVSALGTLQLGVTLDVAIVMLLASAAMAAISSFIPARSASRMPILESLRSFG